jgi:membrane protein
MERIPKTTGRRIQDLIAKITDDNLFLLSSSVSYYSALGLAPFLLILLGVASILGQNVQERIVTQTSESFSPQVGNMISLIFDNVNQGVNLGSLSGIIGVVILLSTASMVFLQFRYAFDVIYGNQNPFITKSTWKLIRERFFAMTVLIGGAVLVILSFSLAKISEFLLGPGAHQSGMVRFGIFWVNLAVNIILFTGAHYITPSHRPKLWESIKIATLSSFFFMLGNLLLASYLKRVAANSVYGAAGSLLVFLVWTYYSSFTVFLSVEVFIYLRRIGKIR